jgi:hypothetical protein
MTGFPTCGGVEPAAVEDGQEFIGPVVGAGGTGITGAPDVLAAEAGDVQARCRGIGEILEELDKALVAVLVIDVLDVERVGDDLLHAAGAVVVEVLLTGDLAAGAEVGALGLDQPPMPVVEVALDPCAGGDGEEVALGGGGLWTVGAIPGKLQAGRNAPHDKGWPAGDGGERAQRLNAAVASIRCSDERSLEWVLT